MELSTLLLEGLEILGLLLELLPDAGELTGLSGNSELLALLGVLVGSLVGLELVLETHDLDDHDVGAVENKREEEGEAAKVHVALRVKLAGLDLKTLVAHDGSTVGYKRFVLAYKVIVRASPL